MMADGFSDLTVVGHHYGWWPFLYHLPHSVLHCDASAALHSVK